MSKKLYLTINKNFQSSSMTTPEWTSAYRMFTIEMRKILRSLGASKIEFNKGHFYISGFFTAKNGQIYYFSISDVRFFKEDKMLIRTAESYKDYTGGSNQFVSISNLKENLRRMGI